MQLTTIPEITVWWLYRNTARQYVTRMPYNTSKRLVFRACFPGPYFSPALLSQVPGAKRGSAGGGRGGAEEAGAHGGQLLPQHCRLQAEAAAVAGSTGQLQRGTAPVEETLWASGRSSECQCSVKPTFILSKCLCCVSQALDLSETNTKALFRRAQAWQGLKDYSQAMVASAHRCFHLSLLMELYRVSLVQNNLMHVCMGTFRFPWWGEIKAFTKTPLFANICTLEDVLVLWCNIYHHNTDSGWRALNFFLQHNCCWTNDMNETGLIVLTTA